MQAPSQPLCRAPQSAPPLPCEAFASELVRLEQEQSSVIGASSDSEPCDLVSHSSSSESGSESSDSEEAAPAWRQSLRHGGPPRATRTRRAALEPPPGREPASKHSTLARGSSREPRTQLYPHAATELLFVPPPRSAAELHRSAEPAQDSSNSSSAGTSSAPSAEPTPPEVRKQAQLERAGSALARRRKPEPG